MTFNKRILFQSALLLPLISPAVTFDVEGLRYNVISMSDKTVEVAIIPKSISYPSQTTYKGDIIIPSKVTYNDIEFDVIGIGQSAFSSGGSQLTSVKLPESITYIGFGAFAYSSYITELNLPKNLTSIGAAAFRDTGIKSIVIPNSVTDFQSTIFYDCRNLESVVLPQNLSSIPESTFQGCSSLSTVNIPSKVTSIGDAAFMGCSSLHKCELPNTITELGNGCFYGAAIDSITVPEGVTAIKQNTFYNCQNLSYVILPKQ